MAEINWALALAVAPLVGFIGMFAGGFWGVGCGWLVVPSMLVFFHCTPMQAAGIGLLQMVPSIIGTVCKEAPSIGWSRSSIGRNLVVPMAIGSLLTSFAGKPINEFFHERCGSTAIMIGFGAFMFVVGVQTLFGRARRYGDETPLVFTARSRALAFIGGLGAGVFSSVLGVGGAMVFRPVLASGFKTTELDTARCVRFLLLTTTLVGGINYLFNSPNGFDPKILTLSLAIALGGAIGFPLGAKAHYTVVRSGYAPMAQRSFAIICAIVFTNSALVVLGYEKLSRFIMFAAAILLIVFLSTWTLIARRKLLKRHIDS